MDTNTKQRRHKQFFCDLLQHKPVAEEFLQLCLKQEIQAYVDWNTLALHAPPLSSAEKGTRYAHVLYGAQTMDDRSTLYFILNHLYEPDPALHLSTLKYAISVLEENIGKNPPQLVQLTAYNGLEHPYPHPRTYFECFQSPELAREMHLRGPIIIDTPENPYPHERTVFDYYDDRELATKVFFEAHRIIDFRDYTDEELAGHQHVGALGLAMKHANDAALSGWMKANQAITQKLKTGPYADQVWQYLLSS